MPLLGGYQQMLTAEDRLGVGQRGWEPRCARSLCHLKELQTFRCILVRDGADLGRDTKDLFQAKAQVMCHAASPELYLSMVTWA